MKSSEIVAGQTYYGGKPNKMGLYNHRTVLRRGRGIYFAGLDQDYVEVSVPRSTDQFVTTAAFAKWAVGVVVPAGSVGTFEKSGSLVMVVGLLYRGLYDVQRVDTGKGMSIPFQSLTNIMDPKKAFAEFVLTPPEKRVEIIEPRT